MTATHRQITRADIMPAAEYGAIRREQRRRIAEFKRSRRVEVGPYATFHFENFDTMWHQVHEMLFVEKGGELQIQDELDAYNPLIPNGNELIATVMFEIADDKRRVAALHAIGGIENHMLLSFGPDRVRGEPDPTRENTSPEGKASSVQFVRFALNEDQKRYLAGGDGPIMLGFDHPHYGHFAMIPDPVRKSLVADLSLSG